jgi:excinuclease UvrABC nuclease subunit
MQGIYLITNTLNGHKYVGRSINITKRWKEHLYSSRREDGFLLHKAIKKHGVENFSFQVLEETDKLYERECFWYQKINPEYNMIRPDEQPNRVQSIKIKSFNKDNGEINFYNSIREAARKNNVSKTAISNALNKKRNSSNNCYWAYENEDFVVSIDRGNNGERRKGVVISNEKETLYFDSISDCSRFLKVSSSLISRIISGSGRAKRAKGYSIKLNL